MGFISTVKGASDWLNAQDTGGYAKNPPLTQTASSHSITIKTDRGIRIGRIQNWSPNLTRTVDTEFEVQANNTGEPIERIPQAQTGNSISVERYELYVSHMGEAFGTPVIGGDSEIGSGGDLVSLIQQVKPFHVREIWRDPYGSIRAYIYTSCWFSNIGTTIAATDDRIIKARATLEFTRRLRLA